MKRIITIAFIVTIAATAAMAVDIPNTFVAGEPASADEVNENFRAVADAIDLVETTYTGESPIDVDEVARTIGLNAATNPGDVLTWDGSNWVARPLSGAGTASNMQPYLAVNFIIALQGVFPSRNSAEPFIAEIIMFAGNFAPRNWAFCDGQLLQISQYSALFSLVGTTYGGDGRTTFGLPDLRGRVPLHAGQGPGLSDRRLGEVGGSENLDQ